MNPSPTTRYFRLTQDYWAIAGSQRLGELVTDKGEVFELAFQLMGGGPVNVKVPLKCRVRSPGTPLDFSLACGDIPVVPERIARRLVQLAPGDVQTIPVEVEGQTEPHCLLVATRTVSCIDEAMCTKVEYRDPKAGSAEQTPRRYSRVEGLRVDSRKASVAQFFRPAGWTVALIASEHVLAGLLAAKVSGLDFECVSPAQS